jgi:hypothetical protein
MKLTFYDIRLPKRYISHRTRKSLQSTYTLFITFTTTSTSNNMFGSHLYLLSAVVVLLSAVSSIAVVPRPQRNPITGKKVGSNSTANNTNPVGLNVTIHNKS